MLAVAHTITGAAVGAAIPNVPLALIGGIAVHFLMDTFVHWNFYGHRHKPIIVYAALDVIAALILAYVLLGQRMFQPSILAGMLGGNLPDIIAFPILYFNFSGGKWHVFHNRLQNETLSPVRGLVSQAIVIAISIVIFRLT